MPALETNSMVLWDSDHHLESRSRRQRPHVQEGAGDKSTINRHLLVTYLQLTVNVACAFARQLINHCRQHSYNASFKMGFVGRWVSVLSRRNRPKARSGSRTARARRARAMKILDFFASIMQCMGKRIYLADRLRHHRRI